MTPPIARGPSYERPASLAEASRLLAGSAQSRPLSGGTDLAVGIRHGLATPEVVVDLKAVPELRSSIELVDGVFKITANTVMTDLEGDERIRARLPGLVEAAQVVGSVQIRNRATLAGNLCNASPAADTPPVLMALGANVATYGPSGERRLSIDQFLVDYRTTALEAGEIITALHIPEPPTRSSSAFLKLGVRRAMEISVVCVGASIAIDDEGAIAAVGLGLGSVAPVTFRPTAAEELLVGQRPSETLFAAAGEAAGEASTPIDDLRARAGYRKAMVPVLVRRALAIAWERAGAAS